MLKHELDLMNIIHLAALCGKVVDDASMDAATARKAWQLRSEWIRLVAREPARDVRTLGEIQAGKRALKTRMVDFLATV
jgi:hypothetical protein